MVGGQADDHEAGKRRRRQGTPSSHRDGKTGTRKCDGGIRGRGQNAEVMSGSGRQGR